MLAQDEELRGVTEVGEDSSDRTRARGDGATRELRIAARADDELCARAVYERAVHIAVLVLALWISIGLTQLGGEELYILEADERTCVLLIQRRDGELVGLDIGVTFLEEDAVHEDLWVEGCLVLLILGGISDIDLSSVVTELQALAEEAYSRTLGVDRAEVAEGELKLHTARLILDVAGLVEIPLAVVRGDDRRDDDGLVDERTTTLVECLELANGVCGQRELVRTLLVGTGRIDFVVLCAARSPYPDEHREGECIHSMTIHRIYACRGGRTGGWY